ncbi:hypothetical protein Vretimale_13297 [Volvox reticuliferus]|uniref:DUF1365-domain-containing protein n=2 Tax=Volvox reticuliferus TaxID=1737510 RepID=A0A8J4LTX3_9CHLO|nr:hypothetical protein Vretimale_13297 [Volvox reticuliferus]
MDWLLVAQALNLIGCNIYYVTLAILSLPSLVLYYLGLRTGKGADDAPSSATFYEGQVLHIRKAPARNQFRYAARMAVLDLDAPPSWFKSQAKDHMTADEARKFAGTSGKVKLLTDPMSAGYVQNPISVYYCYSSSAITNGDKSGAPRLERCIAEVTNTPWNERVTFVFNPAGESVCKALHVSPFMDMQNTWHLEASEPDERLKLVVRASHPKYGDYFYADLVGRRAEHPQRVNEEAGLRALLRYGFMPHRVALLIYWQAVKLLIKGVPFYSPPSKAYQRELVAESGEQQQQQQQQPTEQQLGIAVSKTAASEAGKSANGAAVLLNSSNNGHAGVDSKIGGSLCPVAAVAGSWGAAQHTHPRNGFTGKHFLWREAPGWPWREI